MGNNAWISHPTSGLIDEYLYPIGTVKMHLFKTSLMSCGFATRAMALRLES